MNSVISWQWKGNHTKHVCKHKYIFEELAKYVFFLTDIWLPHGQLSAILEGTASLTRCWSLCFVHIWPEGHGEPHNKVGSLSPAECLVGFEPGAFRFLLQRLNPLGHSPQILNFEAKKELNNSSCWNNNFDKAENLNE